MSECILSSIITRIRGKDAKVVEDDGRREIVFKKPINPLGGTHAMEKLFDYPEGWYPLTLDKAMRIWSTWWGTEEYSLERHVGETDSAITESIVQRRTGRVVLGAESERMRGYVKIFTDLTPEELADELVQHIPPDTPDWFRPRQTFIESFRLEPLLPPNIAEVVNIDRVS